MRYLNEETPDYANAADGEALDDVFSDAEASDDEEVFQAYSSYRESRQKLRDIQKNRGFKPKEPGASAERSRRSRGRSPALDVQLVGVLDIGPGTRSAARSRRQGLEDSQRARKAPGIARRGEHTSRVQSCAPRAIPMESHLNMVALLLPHSTTPNPKS